MAKLSRGCKRWRWEAKHIAINNVLHQHTARCDRLELGDTGLIGLVLFFQVGLPHLHFFQNKNKISSCKFRWKSCDEIWNHKSLASVCCLWIPFYEVGRLGGVGSSLVWELMSWLMDLFGFYLTVRKTKLLCKREHVASPCLHGGFHNHKCSCSLCWSFQMRARARIR